MTDHSQDLVSELDHDNRDGFLAKVNKVLRQKYGTGLSPAAEAVLSVRLGEAPLCPTGWVTQRRTVKIDETISMEGLTITGLLTSLTEITSAAHDRVEHLLCNLVPTRVAAATPREMKIAASGVDAPRNLLWFMSDGLQEELGSLLQKSVVRGSGPVKGRFFNMDYAPAHTPTRGSAYVFTRPAGCAYLPASLETFIGSDFHQLTIKATRDVIVHLDPACALRVVYAP